MDRGSLASGFMGAMRRGYAKFINFFVVGHADPLLFIGEIGAGPLTPGWAKL